MKNLTIEYKGNFETVNILDLKILLNEILKISINSKDFIKKVSYSLTDMTNELKINDQLTLEYFYNENSK